MEKAKEQIDEILRTAPFLTLAAFSVRLWQVTALFTARGWNLYCRVDDPLVRAAIAKQARIGFLAGSPEKQIRGQAVARPLSADAVPEDVRSQLGGNIFLVKPYRILVSSGTAESVCLEKSKTGWIPASSEPMVRRYDFNFWLQAARFVSAPLSVMPVLAGTLLAAKAGAFSLPVFIATLAGGLAAHLGTNFLSDYQDFQKGYDTPGALSTHAGVLVQERIEPGAILAAAAACFLVTAMAGIYLIHATGWGICLFGVVGLAGGAAYTAGPFPMKYRGWGEGLTLFLMGPLMVLGAYFAQTRNLAAWPPLFAALALGCLVGSVTLANNLRDMVDDANNGFATLPLKIGFGPGRRAYYGLTLLPFLWVLALIVIRPALYPLGMVFLSLPFAIQCVRRIMRGGSDSAAIRLSALKDPYPLNSIRLYLRFSVLLLAGIGLSFWI